MAAVSDEELRPELTFEIADLLGQRRRRNVKSFGGSTKMQFLRNGDEVVQLPEFHVLDGIWLCNAGPVVGDRWGLTELGHKSWTPDDEDGFTASELAVLMTVRVLRRKQCRLVRHTSETTYTKAREGYEHIRSTELEA